MTPAEGGAFTMASVSAARSFSCVNDLGKVGTPRSSQGPQVVGLDIAGNEQ